MITHDRTAETIFSSHIDTWKNMGNFQFIDHVGWCFSTMNTIEEMFNAVISGIVETSNNIVSHPSDYPGNTKNERLLRDETVRSDLKSLHNIRRELGLYAANIRMENQKDDRDYRRPAQMTPPRMAAQPRAARGDIRSPRRIMADIRVKTGFRYT